MSCTPVGATSRTTNTACEAGDGSTNTQPPDTGDLLPGPMRELSSSNDVGAQLAGLILKSAYAQKEGAREAREMSERAQRSAEDQQLKDMKSEADSNLVAGLMESGTEIAGGAMNIGGAFSSEGTSKALGGSAEVVRGIGKVDSAFAKHDASMSKLSATAQEQTASREKRAVDDARDLDKEAKEMLNRALSYYKEYLTAKADTERAALLKA